MSKKTETTFATLAARIDAVLAELDQLQPTPAAGCKPEDARRQLQLAATLLKQCDP